MREGTDYLSKREQQIMEVAYSRERVTATELCAALHDSPSNASVRTLLRILEEKGQLSHVEEVGRFVYSPVQSKQTAGRRALDRLVETFFRGSVGEVVAALLRDERQTLTPEEIARLERLIEEAKRKG